jgi:hypothetical protein
MPGSTTVWASLLIGVATLGACTADDSDGGAGMSGGACLAPLDLECTPAYEPTFDQIYDRRIRGTCATGGGNCHGAEGNKGGLTMADADGAYNALLGVGLGHARVIAGDPECSVLIKRLESDDLSFVMPLGRPLSAGERCTIRQWVANGAERE